MIVDGAQGFGRREGGRARRAIRTLAAGPRISGTPVSFALQAVTADGTAELDLRFEGHRTSFAVRFAVGCLRPARTELVGLEGAATV